MGSGSQLLFALLNAAAFMLCVGFLAYVILIVVPYLRHRRSEPGDASAFEWHLIIPALDEALVIEATVAELRHTFPRTHLWIVDDASQDATPQILRRLSAQSPFVHVVTRQHPLARQGKGPALNAGYAAIVEHLGDSVDPARTIIGVVDADARLDPQCFDMVAGPQYFADPAVGAVQIEVRVTDHLDSPKGPLGALASDPMLIRLQDVEFAGPIAAMQILRGKVGSVGMGGNGQFSRLSVLQAVVAEHGTPWHGALLEDFELGLHVLLAGGRTEYCHDTWVAQEGLRRFKPLLRQRSRWSQGSMQCIRYLWPVMRSPKISTPGAIEIAYFLLLPWLQLIGGLVYAGVSGIALYYLAADVSGFAGWLRTGAWGILPLFLVFGLAPFLVWGPIHRRRNAPDLTAWQAIKTGAANVAYTYFHYAAVWWAFFRLVALRRDWKKTARRVPRLARIPVPAIARRLAGGRGVPTVGVFRRRTPALAAIGSTSLATDAAPGTTRVLVTGHFTRKSTPA